MSPDSYSPARASAAAVATLTSAVGDESGPPAAARAASPGAGRSHHRPPRSPRRRRVAQTSGRHRRPPPTERHPGMRTCCSGGATAPRPPQPPEADLARRCAGQANTSLCPRVTTFLILADETAHMQANWRNPLTDSNRRPPPHHEREEGVDSCGSWRSGAGSCLSVVTAISRVLQRRATLVRPRRELRRGRISAPLCVETAFSSRSSCPAGSR